MSTSALPTTTPSACSANTRCLRRRGDAEPDGHGQRRGRAHLGDRRRQAIRQGCGRAGDAETGDEVDEALRAAHRRGQALRPGGGRDQPDEVERARLDGGLDCGIAARGQVGQQHAGHAERVGVMEEAVDAVSHDRVEVAEHDDRMREPGPLDQRERPRQRHSLPERVEGRALDGRAVGERVAERHSDLQDVAELVGGPERRETGLGGRVAGREVRNQGGAPASAHRGPCRREPGFRQSNRRR